MATWRSGYAPVCKTGYAGSIPAVASNNFKHLAMIASLRPRAGVTNGVTIWRLLRSGGLSDTPPTHQRPSLRQCAPLCNKANRAVTAVGCGGRPRHAARRRGRHHRTAQGPGARPAGELKAALIFEHNNRAQSPARLYSSRQGRGTNCQSFAAPVARLFLSTHWLAAPAATIAQLH
jgi:hypothetical protein